MPNYKKFVLLSCALLIHLFVIAQTTDAAPSKDGGLMRSEAKIYVVMAVVITILAGLLIYLVRLDRKITRLEKGNL
ncbi:MAG: CcmD family protein [Bacteroidota bacterium]|nr:CcmD family protein [Bacteroidota bacterium]